MGPGQGPIKQTGASVAQPSKDNLPHFEFQGWVGGEIRNEFPTLDISLDIFLEPKVATCPMLASSDTTCPRNACLQATTDSTQTAHGLQICACQQFGLTLVGCPQISALAM